MKDPSNGTGQDAARRHAADEPAYGIRLPEEELASFPASPSSAKGGLPSGRYPAGHSADPGYDRPRALRRMAGGLSFACCMLGILVLFGLLATGSAGWSLIGVAPILVGLAGLVSVRWRLVPSFRDASGPRVRRPGARLFWIPGVLAVLGLVAVVISYLVPNYVSGEDTLVRNHVILWAEIGLVLILSASLSAGLIALSLWTVPDEDDAILRQTDYAERRRARERGTEDFYDSDWFRGNTEDLRDLDRGGKE